MGVLAGAAGNYVGIFVAYTVRINLRSVSYCEFILPPPVLYRKIL